MTKPFSSWDRRLRQDRAGPALSLDRRQPALRIGRDGEPQHRRRAGPAQFREPHRDAGAGQESRPRGRVCTPPSVRYGIARDLHRRRTAHSARKAAGRVAERGRRAGAAGARKAGDLVHHLARAAQSGGDRGGEAARGREDRLHEDRVARECPQMASGPGLGLEPALRFRSGTQCLSIATRIFPGALFVRQAELFFPENTAPIAANLRFEAPPRAHARGRRSNNWRETGGETWTIELRTEAGDDILLADGGARLVRNGKDEAAPGPANILRSTRSSPASSTRGPAMSTWRRCAWRRTRSSSAGGRRWKRSRIRITGGGAELPGESRGPGFFWNPGFRREQVRKAQAPGKVPASPRLRLAEGGLRRRRRATSSCRYRGRTRGRPRRGAWTPSARSGAAFVEAEAERVDEGGGAEKDAGVDRVIIVDRLADVAVPPSSSTSPAWSRHRCRAAGWPGRNRRRG